MKLTVEISFYPLNSDYEASVIEFIQYLKSNEKLHVLTTAMSTYVKGESKDIFEQLEKAICQAPSEVLSATLIKVLNKDVPVERGFLEF